MPAARRIEQRNWDAPDRAEWVHTLDAALETSDTDVILVAHSLGCALVVWWAATCSASAHAVRVKGALLVAPPDVERADFPIEATGFAPMPQMPLPFPGKVIASTNDPWCDPARSQQWAAAWHAEFHSIGPKGHLNAATGLAEWPEGQQFLH